jgi:hypothetical protein
MYSVSRDKRTADLWKLFEDLEPGTGIQLLHPRRQLEHKEVDSKPVTDPIKTGPPKYVFILNTTGNYLCSHIPTQKWRRSVPSQTRIYLTYRATQCQNYDEVTHTHTLTHTHTPSHTHTHIHIHTPSHTHTHYMRLSGWCVYALWNHRFAIKPTYTRARNSKPEDSELYVEIAINYHVTRYTH